MSILPSWSPFFQPTVRMHGRAAQVAGRVRRVEPEPAQLLKANVGNHPNGDVSPDGTPAQPQEATPALPHTVIIAAEGRHALCECTCEAYAAGQWCEHIYAALMDVAHGEGPGASLEQLAKLTPRPPRARKREGESVITPSQEPRWMSRLTLLRPSAESERKTPINALLAAQRQVVYVILPGPSMRYRGLVVELQQRSAISTGWSKPKSMKLGPDTLDTLADPTDRELCAMLMGSARVGEDESILPRSLRQHATYRIAEGAQRSLLRRMIDTGRCFIDLAEPDDEPVLRPLRWELPSNAGETKQEPWTLWLEGKPEDGGMRLDLQLRRAGRRVAVQLPVLLLGGPDGLVVFREPLDRGQRRIAVSIACPFDDRDAFTWVSQFRDQRFIDEDALVEESSEVIGASDVGSAALVIGEQELTKFLERLYLLPTLPELDLPDGFGHSEHRIEPVPHLDLYSPGTAAASELGASGKSLLAARLWFDYGGQRVNPAQSGRFVPVAIKPDDAQQASPNSPADTSSASSSSASSEASGNGGVSAAAVIDPSTAEDEPLHPDANPTGRRLIRRNFRAEREAIEQTAGLGLARASSTAEDALIVPARHVPTLVSTLLFKGWVIAADQKLVRVPGPPALSVSSGIDWFELRGNVSFTGADGQQHEVSLPDILRAARSGRLMVTLGDGSQGMLPEQWLAEHGLLTAMGELHGDHLRFRNSQASLLDALLTEQELAEIDDPFRHAREALRNFEQLSPREAEPDFHGTLRTYQKLSLGWFSFLRDLRLGGILADDMGLGKTVQVLAMLHARSKTDHEHGPRTSLIVAPRSVVFNWLDEAKRFTPELHVLAYTGPDRQQQLASLDQYDLVVTSYGLLRRDIDALQNLSFDYAVLDEAQAIKNGSSQAAKAARLIQARHRLALTGTPVENHLGDLWSIFEYLNPGMLGSNTRFADLVKGATQAVQQEESSLRGNDEIRMTNDETLEASSSEDSSLRVSGPAKASPLAQLASSLRPFILRRTKKQVLTDLPAKTEQTILCEMDDAQRKIYNDLRDYYRGTLMNQLDANGVSRGNGLGSSSFMVLEALLRLRQAACHPALIDKDGRYKDAPSAKLDAMLEMLAEVLDEGQKALVFSQFTSMLGLVREKLDELGIRYCYLDGQTRNRKQVVEQFQNDPDVQVFLISLKAGGVGLNLTAAEYVFILDPWWNPAVEQQAIDRTHRIGQSKPVFAYRLVCEDTVEQHILELQQAKRTLAEAIVDGEQNVLQSLTRDDLERLLA